GLISYPLYLWHWPLISMANIISLEPPSVALRVVLVLSSFVLAWLTLKLLEKPLRSTARNKLKTYGFSFGMAVAACIGYFTYEYDGLPGRYPEEVRLIAEKTKITDFDWENKVRSHACHIQVPDREK
ncbi:MAG: acyltransferase family protein, partial [Bdellovibrio sp.]